MKESNILGTHKRRMDALLAHFHGCGLTLATCADSKHLGRSVTTLKRYVRRLGLSFPDYTPQALRPKKERKRLAA